MRKLIYFSVIPFVLFILVSVTYYLGFGSGARMATNVDNLTRTFVKYAPYLLNEDRENTAELSQLDRLEIHSALNFYNENITNSSKINQFYFGLTLGSVVSLTEVEERFLPEMIRWYREYPINCEKINEMPNCKNFIDEVSNAVNQLTELN
ncbi:hypothetical protein [Ostreibacterium oceani]|uniref:Uncharacterized protein n=1 Tax=Ostreibacterium oceani TaxID=2654998 RepID=A0A6N7F1V7_9GAMM|nr:hypothetical protein [Ostreibacterium oceani]MPV85846.1 hypothetical protein [Ostreibacterium oceani]